MATLTTVNFGEYILALAVGTRTSPNRIELTRFAGMAFFIRADGLVATCAHIIETLQANEVLVGHDMVTRSLGEILDVRKHPQFDFATGRFLRHHGPKVLPHYDGSTLLGLDVQAFGCTADGRSGRDFKITPRLFKGSIVGQGQDPSAPGARSSVEVSFPSHKGFSGTPLLVAEDGLRISGMLFSNLESTIEQYSYSETDEAGRTFSERLHKVVELGIAHSPADIQSFIADLD